MSVDILKKSIEDREEQRLKAKQTQYPRRNCIASDLGECLRERFYAIKNWELKPIADTHLQARFEAGMDIERRIIMNLMANNFEVVEGQKRFEVKDRNGRVIITGKIEGKIRFEGKYYPFEIKSMHPNIYDGIDKLEDFEKFAHTKKYPKQLMSYMFNENVDEGFFILSDCLGHFKIIPIKLDYGMMERELQYCTIVMDSLGVDVPPPFHQDKSVCRKCWACKVICHPDIDFGEGVQIIDDPEMENSLKRRDELQPIASEYKKLDEKLKENLKAYKHALCGNYEIQVKTTETNYKAQEARVVKVTKVTIDKIESDITTEV